jgi:hypothetical protein
VKPLATAVDAFFFTPADASRLGWLMWTYRSHSPPTDLAPIVARSAALCTTLALGTIAIETAYPLVLVSRIARVLFVAGAVGMHVGIYLLQGIGFTALTYVHLFYIPWDKRSAVSRQLSALRNRLADS